MPEPDDVLASTPADLERVRNPRFPLSATWDPTWQLENMMGTNPLWLTEERSIRSSVSSILDAARA